MQGPNWYGNFWQRYFLREIMHIDFIVWIKALHNYFLVCFGFTSLQTIGDPKPKRILIQNRVSVLEKVFQKLYKNTRKKVTENPTKKLAIEPLSKTTLVILITNKTSKYTCHFRPLTHHDQQKQTIRLKITECVTDLD